MAKKLTVAQKQKGYRVAQYTCLGSEFVATLTPFIIMGAVNADKWFKSEDGWKIGLGGALALALMGIAVFLVTAKKDNENKLTNGWITLIVGWFAVAFIFVLLANIMDQISTIMFIGGIGLLAAFGLDITSKQMKKKSDTYKEVLGDVNKDKLKEQVEKEYAEEQKEKQKVKVKVVNK